MEEKDLEQHEGDEAEEEMDADQPDETGANEGGEAVEPAPEDSIAEARAFFPEMNELAQELGFLDSYDG